MREERMVRTRRPISSRFSDVSSRWKAALQSASYVDESAGEVTDRIFWII
jgi:hypothetical protein